MRKDRETENGKSADFIILSYARPQNMQRLLDAILNSRSCGKVVLSNNNPAIDILDYVDPSPESLEIIQQKEKWEPVKRFCIAREIQSEYFVCIDDDLFLTTAQIDQLVDRMIAEPDVPHGVWGAQFGFEPDGPNTVRPRLESGVHNYSGEVRLINRAYAFTRKHVERFFELMEFLGIEDPRDLGPADDILLSYSGTGRPKCHDLGPLENCPTSDQEGIAVWKEQGFFEKRVEKLVQLTQLLQNH
jgi:hypothetical protein